MGLQPTFYRAAGWLLLAAALVLGAWWQYQARGHQFIDVGSALDEGFVADFYGRELSDDGHTRNFRWSRPEAELLPQAAPEPSALHLRMLAPATADGTPATLRLDRGKRELGSFPLATSFRIYSLLLPPVSGDERLTLHVTPLSLPGDPRSLGLVLDTATLQTLGAPRLANLLGELFVFPYLPEGLLCVAALIALAGAPAPAPGAATLGALGGLALVSWGLNGAQLVLAWSLTVAAGTILLAVAALRLTKRLPALYPSTDRRAGVWLCAAWGLAFILGFSPWITSDGTGYFAYTHSLVVDGDLNFGNEYREMPFDHRPADPNIMLNSRTGLYENPFSVGPGLLWLPGFYLADLFVRYGAGGYWSADGYTLPYIALSLLTTALAGLVMLLTMYRICRRMTGPPLSALAALTIFFGSNPCYYALREGSFAHGLSGMAAALFVLAWLRLEERPSPGRWAALGATGGLTALLYWASALTLIPAVFSFGKQLVQSLRASSDTRADQLRALVVGAGLALLCGLAIIAPQLIAWNILFGSPLTVPQGTSFITPGAPVVGPFLFSSLHGMLPWTPAAFVGMIGLGLLLARQPWRGLALSLGLCTYLFYNMTLSTWHGGGAFGMRRLTVLAPVCAIGLTLLFVQLRRVHWSLPLALAALTISWTTLLSWRYELYLIERNVGSLEQMPLLSFLLGRDALPLDQAGTWLASGFFAQLWSLSANGAPWQPTLALALLVAALTAAGLVLALRVARAPFSEPA